MRRILYLWLPHWPIDRLRRSSALSPGRNAPAAPAEEAPFATVIDAGGRRLLAAVNPAAAAAGLAPGMPLADALSFLPGLVTKAAEPAQDAAALRRLAEWCGRYSPWTAPDPPEGIKIEITGCAHLWGGEERLAADLGARLGRQGLASHIAVADTLGAAWACARFAKAGRQSLIQPSGEMRAGLASLPVEALRLDPATAEGLRRVGLRRIGDLYAMPRAALARRFGEIVARRLDQALDHLPEPLSPLDETPARRVRLSFAEPISEPADFALAAERLAQDLVIRLTREGTGARRLVLAFHRVDGRVEHIRLGTARPSRDPHHIAALFKERLETIDPGLGVEDMILAAFAVEPLGPEQLGLPRHNPPPEHSSPVIPAKAGSQERSAQRFGALDPCLRRDDGKKRRDDEKKRKLIAEEEARGDIAPLFDRLGNRLGLDALCRLEPRESHIPERAAVRVYLTLPPLARGEGRVRGVAAPRHSADPPHPSVACATGPSLSPLKGGEGLAWRDQLKPPRPIRLFDPPEPIEAAWLLPDDPPFRFTWRRRAHRVREADGPERIAEEWWRPGGSSTGPGEGGEAIRDYYRVEDEEGRRFWLFRAGLPGDGRPPRWYLHGVFA